MVLFIKKKNTKISPVVRVGAENGTRFTIFDVEIHRSASIKY